MKICSRSDCDDPAPFKAELVVYYAGEFLSYSLFGVEVFACQNHASEVNGHELMCYMLSGDGRKQMTHDLQMQGFKYPDWNRSFIRWIPCESVIAIEK